jgi:hypothetical protein
VDARPPPPRTRTRPRLPTLRSVARRSFPAMVRGLLGDIEGAARAVREAAIELRLVDTQPAPITLDLDQLGAIAVLLALRWPVWVDRREIRITFVDDATVRITTAVSFHLTPEAVGTEIPPGTRLYVPLDTPEKRTLLNLSISDEEGTQLTPLNAMRNGDLAGRGLVRLFSQLLQDAEMELPDATQHALRELAAVPAPEARPHQAVAVDPGGVLGQWLAQGPEKIRPEVQIITGLTEGFLQLVQIGYEPDQERRIETEYDLPLPWPKHPNNKWLVELGALSQQRTFKPVSIGRARGTHIEFVAPGDMDLISASLQGQQYNTLLDHRENLRVHAWSFERSRERAALHVQLLAGSEIHDSTVLAPENGRIFSAHEKRTQLQIEGNSDQASATVSLLPRRSGTVPAASIASTATAITLGFFASRLSELDGQTGAAVLLLLPAVIAAYLSRPGEHRFTTRALRAVRIMAMLSAACAVVLSVMIAGGFLSSTAKPPSVASVKQVAKPKPKPKQPDCLVTGHFGAPRRHGGGSIRMSVTCRSRTAPTSAAVGAAGSNKIVPAGAQCVANGLAIVAAAVALVLVLAWGTATLMARLVPTDDELAAITAIPIHPRPGP